MYQVDFFKTLFVHIFGGKHEDVSVVVTNWWHQNCPY